MRPYSLRLRLVAVMLAVLVVGFAVSFVSIRFSVDNLVGDLRERTLQAQARAVLDGLQRSAEGGIALRLPPDWARAYADPARRFAYTLYDRNHRALQWSPNLTAPLPDVSEHARHGYWHIQFAGVDGKWVLLPVRAPEDTVLIVGRHDLDLEALVDSLFEESYAHLILLAPFALLAIGLLWVIVDRSLRPLARASREATLVDPGRPEVRLNADGLSREMAPLVASMNGALERLARAYATERQLTADAAHELRTPLAVLTLRLQRARLTGQSDWQAIERELEQMSRLVAQLLDLARKESLARQQAGSELPVVNLSRVVREVAAAWVPRVEQSGRGLQVDVPDVANVRARASDLQDMVRNLLENALVHGAGVVSVRLRAAESRWFIEVSDEGPGVPAGEEEAVFARFHRLNAEAPGVGLGLAIVRQVARSHGGDAHFVPGRGCVAVWLPAVGPPAEAGPPPVR